MRSSPRELCVGVAATALFAIAPSGASAAALDPDIDPTIEGDVVSGNTARQNGKDADPRIAPLPGADLL